MPTNCHGKLHTPYKGPCSLTAFCADGATGIPHSGRDVRRLPCAKSPGRCGASVSGIDGYPTIDTDAPVDLVNAAVRARHLTRRILEEHDRLQFITPKPASTDNATSFHTVITFWFACAGVSVLHNATLHPQRWRLAANQRSPQKQTKHINKVSRLVYLIKFMT